MSFNLRRNLLFTAFIIAIISVAWLLIQGVLYAFGALQNEKVILSAEELLVKNLSYTEKINNFTLQEFGANRKVSHLIKAKSYLGFKDIPALLFSPTVTLYDDKGGENYTLAAKRANYFENGNIKFIGNVDIYTGDDTVHKMNTEELLVGAQTKDLISNKKVTYLAEHAKIIASGMYMKPKQDKMKLLGKTRILQNSGQKILTKTLYIDHSKGKKHYYSKNKITYISANNKVYAQSMDMNMDDKLVKLLGKVKILQNSGSKIKTKNLVVDQSKGNEIYRTKQDIHYQSKVADIRAKRMRYDAKKQKIKLSGGVVGRYE